VTCFRSAIRAGCCCFSRFSFECLLEWTKEEHGINSRPLPRFGYESSLYSTMRIFTASGKVSLFSFHNPHGSGIVSRFPFLRSIRKAQASQPKNTSVTMQAPSRSLSRTIIRMKMPRSLRSAFRCRSTVFPLVSSRRMDLSLIVPPHKQFGQEPTLPRVSNVESINTDKKKNSYPPNRRMRRTPKF